MTKRVAFAVLVAAMAFAVTACGGSSSSSSTVTTTGENAETTSGTGGETSAEGGTSSLAAAEKAIAPYVGQPSAFPVTEKLKEVPSGAKVIFAQCGAPFCAFFYELLEPAAKTMGVKLSRIKVGESASTVQSGFETILSEKPDAVIVPGINVELWANELKELQEDQVAVVTTGITGLEAYGVEAPQSSDNSSKLEGELMANYVVAEMNPKASVAFYDTPELPFSTPIEKSFHETLEKVCSECSIRTVHIPVETFGNTAPNTVVADLQANPETTVAVFATAEVEAGLPQALASAGIEVETLAQSPEPTALQYLKEGRLTAQLGLDAPVLAWTMLDQAAREIIGQELTGPQSEGIGVYQFLTPKDITFDPSKGWTGYPDFAERFAKLWGVEG